VRILDVSPRPGFPPTRGSIVRTFNLLRHLGAGNDVKQFALVRRAPAGDVSSVRVLELGPGFRSYQFSHPVAAALVDACERSWFSAPLQSGSALSVSRPALLARLLSEADVALVEFPWQFDYCRRLRPRAPLVLATHNVETLKFRDYARVAGVSTESNPWLDFIESAERRAVERSDLVLAVSPDDKQEFVRRYRVNPCRIVEIPNGVNTERFQPAGPAEKATLKRMLGLPDRHTAVFVGSEVPPNRDAFTWVRELAALAPDVTFLVVGAAASGPCRSANLIATGPVADHVSYLRAADVGLCPVRFGGGTKIKLFEYLACGLPTLAFAASVKGTRVTSLVHALVVDESAPAMLGGLRFLLGHDAAPRMGLEARRLSCVHHDWRCAARVLEEALAQLAQRRRASS
jgi:glycosyltransferase involved in cell wall biosynthesis